ncbi:MAG: hypothetical protein KF686_04910 [Ramlibacter sp.]|nr:hypothetical protein [Ramlibacter sp.]
MPSHPLLIRGLAASAFVLLGATSALAASTRAPSAAQERYQQERAICLNGQSQQDRATCLREAGAAYAQARKGDLSSTGSTDYAANAVARCNAQPPADRDDCVRRIREGAVQGSVNAGGVLREVETPVQ